VYVWQEVESLVCMWGMRACRACAGRTWEEGDHTSKCTGTHGGSFDTKRPGTRSRPRLRGRQDRPAPANSRDRLLIPELRYFLLSIARILALDIIIIIIFQAQGAWQWSRWQAPERGGLRLPRQAEAGGTSHRHPVSGPRGCRALPLHFPRCSLGALRRIGAAMASGEAASA
jgi:hypothetical protein